MKHEENKEKYPAMEIEIPMREAESEVKVKKEGAEVMQELIDAKVKAAKKARGKRGPYKKRTYVREAFDEKQKQRVEAEDTEFSMDEALQRMKELTQKRK